MGAMLSGLALLGTAYLIGAQEEESAPAAF
jgi:hypothetical protein